MVISMVLEYMNKKRWLAAFLIVLAVMFLRVLVQPLMPSDDSGLTPSAIVNAGLLIPSFVLFGLVTYGLVALVFVLIQDGLPGKKTMKGLIFGVLFGMMWAVLLFEPLPFGANVPLANLLAYPIVDCLTLVILGLLLGRFVGTDTAVHGRLCTAPLLLAFAAIPLSYMVGRYVLDYNLIHIYSAFAGRPFDTMLWVVVTGLWFGVMYLYLRAGIGMKSVPIKAAYFAVIVVGIDLFLFNLFPLLVFQLDIPDLLIRTAIDIVSLTVGAYAFEVIYAALRGDALTLSSSGDSLQ
jgi:hypothetical protein